MMSSCLRHVSSGHEGILLQWHQNERDGVSNHQPHNCLLNGLFRPKSNKTSKLRVTGLCVGNSLGPVNSPHKGPVTQKMFSFDDVIMLWCQCGITTCKHAIIYQNQTQIGLMLVASEWYQPSSGTLWNVCSVCNSQVDEDISGVLCHNGCRDHWLYLTLQPWPQNQTDLMHLTSVLETAMINMVIDSIWHTLNSWSTDKI